METLRRSYDGRFARADEALSAEAVLAAKQAELAQREAGSSKGGTVEKLHPIFAAYLSHLERKGRDPKTVSRNRYALLRLTAMPILSSPARVIHKNQDSNYYY